MRAPAFWDARPGPLARALSPLGALYAGATARRLRTGARFRPGVPVICVGNLTVGGAGKTPTVIALAQRLTDQGVAVQIVSRGHGGRVTTPHRVDERRDDADLTGDEPLLLAAFAPVWVAADRVAVARAAVADGAQAILLDDGFQDPSLWHDLSIVVANAAQGFGNGLCLPAGPLREPVVAGLSRADLLLTVGDATAQAGFDARWSAQVGRLERLRGALQPLQTGMDWRGMRVLAFAGIAHPARFFATLQGVGAEILRAVPLDDHQRIPMALLARLEAEARGLGAQLVTTEKDAVRLPRDARTRVLTLPVRLAVQDWAPLDAAFQRVLDR